MGTTAEKLAYLDATKTAIKNAIVSKGTDVPEGTTFRQYADLISGISTGLSDEDLAKATATPGDVTAGKTFYAGNREMKTGTAQGGLTLKMQYTGTISPSNSLTVDIKSKTFFVVGAGYDAKDRINLNVCRYVSDGKPIISTGLWTSISYVPLNDGYRLTISSSYYTVKFDGLSIDGFFPLLIFEG